MRMRDLHILTVAHVTYSADERFQVRGVGVVGVSDMSKGGVTGE